MREGSKVDLSLVDTNILVYAYDQSEKKKHEIAKELLKKCFEGKIKYALSTQNLSEFFVEIIKKIEFPLSKRDVSEIIKEIIEFDNLIILDIKPNTIISAVEISNKHDMSYWDSLLAATMKENGITEIYTENEKDFKLPWVKVVNPFKK